MNTPPSTHTLNPLTLPLHGLQLIEASAGTGKTFTLAALYLRLVLERGLFAPQILVMTFTEAATAELRERIRERLAQAARFFAGDATAQADAFLIDLGQQIAPADWSTCAARLDLAAQWMDEAAIFTIHGWCSRMLKTHAFDSASLFEQSRVEDSDRLKRNAVQDYWRRWFYALPAAALGALKAVGSTPQALLDKLKNLWRSAERAPGAPAPALEPPDVLLARWAVWARRRAVLEVPARQGWTAQVAQAVNDAAAARLLTNYRANWLPGWLGKMQAWAQGGEIDSATLERFTLRTLSDKGWPQAAHWGVFVDLQTLHDHLLTEPQVATDLLAHAAREIAADVQRAKARAAQFDFSDLLQNLYHALQAPDGRLAAAIAAQYPVALVDEFQDTDPWQFGSLRRIYVDKSSMSQTGNAPLTGHPGLDPGSLSAAEHGLRAEPALTTTGAGGDGKTNDEPAGAGLIMIGDPKQAIYSFRGADLATYLAARAQAQGIYTLPVNFRSTTGVVNAVNTVFGLASAPFGSVPFLPVTACKGRVAPLQLAGQAQVAMTVWHQPFAKTPTKPEFLTEMAALFASQMVALLQTGAARSGDMAVLVRDWQEAAAIRSALAARGVRSVYLSERNSVFESGQAADLWRILRAVANPGSNRLVRAALVTRTWGLHWAALDALLADEAAWDALVEQFMRWQRVWRTQGFLPMLYRLLHDQGLPGKLLADAAQGERALTNLLHLGELLQAQSLQVQGEGALIRYLEDQLRNPKAQGDAAQLRLESEANLVQVVTFHKAKGLEYPLVYLPFVSLFKEEKKDSDRSDAERLEEDIRLFYVALTRAKLALWLGVAQVRGDMDGKSPVSMSALSVLLGRQRSDDLWERLQSWACADIQIAPAPAVSAARYQPPAVVQAAQPARTPVRLHTSHWWSASFSALTRDLVHEAIHSERDEQLQDAQLDSAPVVTASAARQPLPDDDIAPDLFAPTLPYNDFPAGSAYGTLLHDLLEWQAQHGWPAAQPEADAALAAEWIALLARQRQRLNLTEADAAMLAGWIPKILKRNMPLAHVNQAQVAMQLGAIEAPSLWPEMGFTLPVHSLSSAQLDARIAQHLWPQAARAPLQPRQLQGMVTGFMDLVLQHDGRYYVLDYKSNKLGSYEAPQLQQAMLAHRYDVQATLYLLALHRLLRARLGKDHYDYDRDVGGALYLFLRGVDQPGSGLVHLQPPRVLIESLDLALRGTPAPEGA